MNKKNEPKIRIAPTVFMALMVTSVFAALAIGIVGVSASGPTYVSGIISSNTTWTAADSPYIVTGNILVEEGVTLTIEPDVVVKFNSGKALLIDGELIAQGTEAEPIVFTSNQSSAAPGDWVNILFTDSSIDATYDEAGDYLSGCVMQYCTVEYGGGSDTPAIKVVSSSLFIDHCNITNSASSGIYVSGTEDNKGSAKITNNIVTDNAAEYIDKGGGICVYYGTAVIISKNVINSNLGVGFGGGIYTSYSTATISENIIGNNSASCGGGICVYDRSTATLNKNTITDNLADSGGGIYISYSTVTISENTISNNSASGGGGISSSYGGIATISKNTITNNSGHSGGGIRTHYGTIIISENIINTNSANYGGGIHTLDSTITISNNAITDNWADNGGGINAHPGTVIIKDNKITRNSATKSEGGGIVIYSQPTINYNDIYDNTPYDVYNANSCGSPHVNATYNWWGTTDEATIQAHIYDWFDDASLGIVDYSPYLTEPVTPNIPPIASFIYSPESPVVVQTITFNASNSTDPDGNITSYAWDFGDGNNTNTTAPITSYSYASAGTYNVNLTVTDDDGATNSTTKIVTVREAKPTVSISTDKYEYVAGDTMHIDITIANPSEETQPVYFAWRLDLPDYDLQYWITVLPLDLAPGYEQTFTIPFTLGDYGFSFNAAWYVALYNTTTLEVNSEDTADWRYVPSELVKGEIMPEEIAKAVEAKTLLEKEHALRKILPVINETYNYTIRTGSYPQIHHTDALPTANGWINCTNFTDANGRIYTDWIPAIRLE